LPRADFRPPAPRLRAFGCVALLACAGSESGPSVGAGAGPRPETDVRRGELRVHRQLVQEVQRALGLSEEQALDLTVEDAVLAQHLVSTEPALAQWIERAALARALLASLRETAERQGPVSDAEVLALRDQRWWELDRPRMVQVIHAVVVSSADQDAAARALAERILASVETAPSVEDFQKAAAAVPSGGLSVKIERLPPVALDGRALDPDRPPPAGPGVQSFDADFAVAAQRLEREGQLSPVVRTSFGYHVLRAIRVIPPRQPTLVELRESLRGEVMEQRARLLQVDLLDQRRKEAAPEQMRSALAMVQQLSAPR
jgi:parvulin-like peptidyl-prolyl cis-trans isomerase-like protein